MSQILNEMKIMYNWKLYRKISICLLRENKIKHLSDDEV